jgi:hypothetical protein
MSAAPAAVTDSSSRVIAHSKPQPITYNPDAEPTSAFTEAELLHMYCDSVVKPVPAHAAPALSFAMQIQIAAQVARLNALHECEAIELRLTIERQVQRLEAALDTITGALHSLLDAKLAAIAEAAGREVLPQEKP